MFFMTSKVKCYKNVPLFLCDGASSCIPCASYYRGCTKRFLHITNQIDITSYHIYYLKMLSSVRIRKCFTAFLFSLIHIGRALGMTLQNVLNRADEQVQGNLFDKYAVKIR